MNKQYLDTLIDQKLGGKKERVVELFKCDDIFDELNRNSKPGDWFYFESKTFDGDYLIRDGVWYVVYYQERGRLFFSNDLKH